MKLDPSLIPINIYSIFTRTFLRKRWTSKINVDIVKYFFFFYFSYGNHLIRKNISSYIFLILTLSKAQIRILVYSLDRAKSRKCR